MSKKDGNLLTIRDLRIEAHDGVEWHEIIHGVNLDLKKGEVVGLIGESGAGKSTLGLGAMGFCRAGCRISGGSVEFDGMELTNASRAISSRRRVR